ncbi:MAG: cytochrome b N-terminal domain-containing protein, partial [Solirubrobacteraceae bacterium]
RLYILHVFLIPALLATLIAVHLGLIAARHHTQFKESVRHTQKRIIGVPMFPGQAPRSLALMFFVVAILFLLGGLVQINPIWQWGPFQPWLATNGAQPDWYLGWLIGALRLMPSFDVVIGHYTLIPNPFWGGVAFPLFVLGVLASFPWVERRLSGDRRVHNLLDRPRAAPNRTAFGVAFLTWIFLIFSFGAADRAYVLFGVSYETLLSVFRVAIWVVPIVLFFVVRRLCGELQHAEQIEQDSEQASREAALEEARMREQGTPPLAGMGPGRQR